MVTIGEFPIQPPVSVVNRYFSCSCVTGLCRDEHTMFLLMSDDEWNGLFKSVNDLISPLGQSSGVDGGITQTTPRKCRESLLELVKRHKIVPRRSHKVHIDVRR